MSRKKKLLFWSLPYHRKTKSNEFLLVELANRFDITECHSDTRNLDQSELLQYISVNYDYLVLWQVMPARELLQQFHFSKGIMFPMFDQVMAMPEMLDSMELYRDFLVICFCYYLYSDLKSRGFDTEYIQYFPRPEPVIDYGDIHSLFFWTRREDLPPDELLARCRKLDFSTVHIHKAMDPGQNYHPVTLTHPYRIEYSDWFPDKTDMEKVMCQSAVYAAPRLLEGIGMSFLGAMAQGRCVIAPNLPTMNEYILNGENGVLYDFDSLDAIEPFDVRKIQETTIKYMRAGYLQWSSDKEKIFEWIET